MRPWLVVFALITLATACKKDQAPQAPPPPPPPQGPVPTEVKVDGALHAVRCGDVTAEWLGEAPEAPAPLSYGVKSLRFRFKDGSVKAFVPQSPLEFSDWTFTLFSPDCATAVLLADRFGPYHVVPTAQLAAYVSGAPPAATLRWQGDGPARVHSELRFRTAGEVEFQAACCGGVDVLRAPLSEPAKAAVIFSAPEAPRGLTRTEAGYEVAK